MVNQAHIVQYSVMAYQDHILSYDFAHFTHIAPCVVFYFSSSFPYRVLLSCHLFLFLSFFFLSFVSRSRSLSSLFLTFPRQWRRWERQSSRRRCCWAGRSASSLSRSIARHSQATASGTLQDSSHFYYKHGSVMHFCRLSQVRHQIIIHVLTFGRGEILFSSSEGHPWFIYSLFRKVRTQKTMPLMTSLGKK